jgi:hypothetical protein
LQHSIGESAAHSRAARCCFLQPPMCSERAGCTALPCAGTDRPWAPHQACTRRARACQCGCQQQEHHQHSTSTTSTTSTSNVVVDRRPYGRRASARLQAPPTDSCGPPRASTSLHTHTPHPTRRPSQTRSNSQVASQLRAACNSYPPHALPVSSNFTTQRPACAHMTRSVNPPVCALRSTRSTEFVLQSQGGVRPTGRPIALFPTLYSPTLPSRSLAT